MLYAYVPARLGIFLVLGTLITLLTVHAALAQKPIDLFDDVTSVEGDSMPDTKSFATGRVYAEELSHYPFDGALSITLDNEDPGSRVEKQADPGGPVRVAYRRAIPGLATSKVIDALEWAKTANGGQVATLRIVSPGAYSVRLAIRPESLPNGTRFLFRAPKDAGSDSISSEKIEEIVQQNLAQDADNPDADLFWGPSVDGEEIILQILLPPGIPADTLKAAFPYVSHLYVDINDALNIQKAIGDSGSCNNDTRCTDIINSNTWKSVARMRFMDGGFGYLCTGTLLNDSATGTYIPYFLTAAHCISSQTVASTLETDFFYISSYCNSGTLGSQATSLNGGAEMLSTLGYEFGTGFDSTLLRLRDSVPAGTYFSGWKITQSISSTIGIHHPSGDLQKTSFGNDAGSLYVCNTSTCAPSTNGHFRQVIWYDGIVEQGSSGSGIFDGGDGNKLYATLSGGYSSCSNQSGADYYADFADAFWYGSYSRWLMDDDAYENNDTLQSAYDLSAYAGRWLGSVSGKGIQRDDDWYKINIGSVGTLSVEAQFIHTGGDIDIALYRANGTQLAISNALLDNESFQYEVASAGTYYIRVYYGNAGNQYDLKWSMATDTNSDIFVRLEEPVTSLVYASVSNIRGYAVSPLGVDRVELYIDGIYRFDIPYGGARGDVGAAYPNYPNSTFSGFSMAYNYKNLEPGLHTILVRAYDTNGSYNESSATFTATRFNSPFISSTSAMNVTGMTSCTASDANSIDLLGITAEGSVWDVRLRWLSSSQGFEISAISPSTFARSTEVPRSGSAVKQLPGTSLPDVLRKSLESYDIDYTDITVLQASHDGGQVLLETDRSLLPQDKNGMTDIYLFDTDLNEFTLVSRAMSGFAGNGDSQYPAMDANADWVVFQSDAADLTVGDLNGSSDIFLFGRRTGLLERISEGDSAHPAIDGSGALLAFEQWLDGRLVVRLFEPGTRSLGETFVSDASSIHHPAISADGRFLSFLDGSSGAACQLQFINLLNEEQKQVSCPTDLAGKQDRVHPLFSADGQLVDWWIVNEEQPITTRNPLAE